MREARFRRCSKLIAKRLIECKAFLSKTNELSCVKEI